MEQRSASPSTARRIRGETVAGHGAALRALLRARASLGGCVALGLLRHALRLAPTLAIGLAIDRVASLRAAATLAAIVSGLCLFAILETIFAIAQQRLQSALKSHLAAATGTTGRRAAASHGALVDLATALGAAPPAILGMLAAIALASGRLVALVAVLLAVQAAITAVASPARRRVVRDLRAGERVADAARAEAGAGRGLGVLHEGAQRRARQLDATRARLASSLERQRTATANATTLLARLGFAAVLGLASLEVMTAAITPGALIATMLVLRQLQSLAEGMGTAWLRVVEEAPDPALQPAPARRGATRAAIELAPGDFVAIVGPTGAGKSTLLRDIVDRHGRALPQDRPAGWVEQQPLLCDLPIAEMLRLAAPEADAARVAAALRLSQLAPLLRQLPLGADQPCGPRGENLPAGLRHLVALAGALARDPQLLVLDALPEAIDAPLRASLLAALLTWRADGRSLVVATSSASWIAAADRIVVLERGHVRADIRPARDRAAA